VIQADTTVPLRTHSRIRISSGAHRPENLKRPYRLKLNIMPSMQLPRFFTNVLHPYSDQHGREARTSFTTSMAVKTFDQPA
jgi:hypothetical protein